MLFRIFRARLVNLSVVALALTIVGCEPAAKPKAESGASASDHGHDHPETLADAVKQLEGICGTIKAAFAKDDTEAAHGPLHDVGHLLKELPELAAKSSLDEAGKEDVKKASESLLDALGEVDKAMHGEGGKKYADVAEAIEASLKVLAEKSKG